MAADPRLHPDPYPPYRGYDDRVRIETEDVDPSAAMAFYMSLPAVPPDALGFDALAFLQAHGTRYRGVWSDAQIASLQTAIRHAQAMHFPATETTSIGGCPIATNAIYEDLAEIAREIGRLARFRDAGTSPKPETPPSGDPTPQSHRAGGHGFGERAPLAPRPKVTPPGGGVAYAEPIDVDPVQF